MHYWNLIRRQAEATEQSVSQILTAQSQFVDGAGNVYMGGEGMGGIGEGRRLVGRTTPPRPGWETWGLEAVGPPFMPPPPARAARKEIVRWRKRNGDGGAP